MTATTSDLALLHRAILTDTADTTARLVYADALEEAGDPSRAHYIRWHCAPSFRHPFPRPSPRKWFAPWWRGKMILRHVVSFETPTLFLMRHDEGGFSTRDQMRATRGFVSHVSLTCAQFLTHAEPLFLAHPITSVKLTDKMPDEDEIGDQAIFGWGVTDDDRHQGAHNVPALLFRQLPIHKDYATWTYWRQYPTAPDARSALSQACVSYGRSLASLPPLAL